ncbi:MAG: ABC transporter ATP-binding protein [Verrucomicrobiae bacterium]|nr:ABC transporter ATP-binding protein [Verrucomicrobiae bacterium]MDW8343828.1 ABC transporter ATP-binding protein [Verrucomicrobiae bacterium]
MDAIRTQNLTKKYRLGWRLGKLKALEGLNLTVREGEVYGLLGPNGSGKSTTLKLLLGLIEPTEGEAWLFDVPCRKVESRLHVGFLPENPYFYRFLTGAETLEFYGKLCHLRGAPLRRRIDELLELVGLSHARNRRLAGYSKGMLQRIGLAQALIHDPKLLLLDEPTAGVDPIGSRDIRDLILRLKQMGKTVLLSSHLLAQVQEVCDRIGVLHLGKMILEGDVQTLIRDQNRLAITVENLPESAKATVESVIARTGGRVVGIEHPQTTLEALFLEAVRKDPRGMQYHD